MNYEQKFAALNALAECSLKMRKPGDWYVLQRSELKDGGMLIGSYGNGSTPEDAIEDHWNKLAMGSSATKPIVTFRHDGNGDQRFHHYWNGFMWVDCTPRASAA